MCVCVCVCFGIVFFNFSSQSLLSPFIALVEFWFGLILSFFFGNRNLDLY